MSYETFRVHAPKFSAPGSCDLLICDEAHRLKNADTLTSRALGALPCAARVLLSGTPLQNRLDEFHAMVDFANPGVLGDAATFRRRFEAPILAGREPGAAPEVAALGSERAGELSAVVNQFILRRTNALLSAHLPPKVVSVVCCRLSPLQRSLYAHFLSSVAATRLLGGSGPGKGTARVLSAITALRKLCNHPKLIWDVLQARASAARLGGGGGGGGGAAAVDGFAGCDALFPADAFALAAAGRGRGGRSAFGRGAASGTLPPGWEDLSGKFGFAAALLAALHRRGNERIVIVSNATQTLDLFGQLCRQRNYPCIRLDGSTSVTKRTRLVAQFNDQTRREFVFLLSSKAGGCGLNLVGANRLMLFDPAWNPADDKQAAARVWRDGQTRRVYVYRLLATGTLDEKIWQRQCAKEGLKCVVDGAAGAATALGDAGADAPPADAALMSAEELKDLFTLRADVASDTLDALDAAEDRDGAGVGARGAADPATTSTTSSADRPQDGKPPEEDVARYARHSRPFTVPDQALVEAAVACPDTVSFVFCLQVDGKRVDDDDGGVGVGAGCAAAAAPPARAPPAAAAPAPPSRLAAAPLADATNAPPAAKRVKAATPVVAGRGRGRGRGRGPAAGRARPRDPSPPGADTEGDDSSEGASDMNASSVDDPASSSGGETEGEASESDGGAPPTQPAATQPSAAKLTASSVEVAASDDDEEGGGGASSPSPPPRRPPAAATAPLAPRPPPVVRGPPPAASAPVADGGPGSPLLSFGGDDDFVD